jgi:hypothetical protein
MSVVAISLVPPMIPLNVFPPAPETKRVPSPSATPLIVPATITAAVVPMSTIASPRLSSNVIAVTVTAFCKRTAESSSAWLPPMTAILSATNAAFFCETYITSCCCCTNCYIC